MLSCLSVVKMHELQQNLHPDSCINVFSLTFMQPECNKGFGVNLILYHH